MKTLSTLLQKTQNFIGGSWMKVLIISTVLAAPISPLPSSVQVQVPGLSPVSIQAAAALTGSNAETEFRRLFQRVRQFAGYLLIIGVVYAGVMFITGKTTLAISVFAGAVVVYGGAYVIDLVNQSFSE